MSFALFTVKSPKKAATASISITRGIRVGDNTHHQLQAMKPVSFKTMKVIVSPVKRVEKLIILLTPSIYPVLSIFPM